MSPVRIGVVLTIVSGVESVRTCLRALLDDSAGMEVDVVVPVERERQDVAVLAAEFDEVRFVDIGSLDSEIDPRDPCAEHRRFDLRRAAGLRHVRGDLIVMLEDHGVPESGFFSATLHAWENVRTGAIGGVVDCTSHDGIRIAAWILDFSAHVPGRVPGTTTVLTDVNVSFRKETIDAVAPTWRSGYHEPRVHAAVAARAGLRREPRMRVTQRRPPMSWVAYLAERWSWGRHFGRGRFVGRGRMAIVLSAVVAVFGSPIFGIRALLRAGVSGRTLRAAPWVVLGAIVWGAGEAAGLFDASRRPTPHSLSET